MLIYLLRHADAATPAETDDARWLSQKGLDQARRVARFCEAHEFEIPLILSSPLKRAHETAGIVARHLASDLLVQEWLTAGMSPFTAVDELAAFLKHPAIMLVGHEPDFSSFVSHLVGIPSPTQINIRKASLTQLDVQSLRPGRARIEFSIPCKLM